MITPLLALVPCLSAPQLPQTPDSLTGPSLQKWTVGRERHASVHYDSDASGKIWARGNGYKASADASGFAFIPFLGSDAPTNHALHLRLKAAVRGATALAIEGPSFARRNGDRVTIRRGAVSVHYDLSPDGVEQSFELVAAPGSGDLVLELGVDTDLEASVRIVGEEQGGFRFANERGGVDYGRAVVLDAEGRRAGVDAELTANGIRLTVPASFLDGAAWPVIVDPFLSPFTIGTSTADLMSPTASFDPFNDRYVVVAEEQFSGADTDLLTWYVDLTGTVSGSAYIDQTTSDWSDPSVSIAASGAVTVAVADSVAVPGSTDIGSRMRRTDGTFEPPVVLKSATASFACVAPDIGRDGFAGQGSSFLFVYNRVIGNDRDVYFMLTNGSTPFFDQPLAVGPAVDAADPSVSETSGICCASLQYVVGWTERRPATGESSVRAALVDYDGGGVFGPFSVAQPTTTAFYFDVDVSTTSSRTFPTNQGLVYLVTYDDRPSNVTDSFVAVCSGGSTHRTYELQASEHADRVPNQNSLRIATGKDQFLLGYEENGDFIMTLVETRRQELSVVDRRLFAAGANLVPGSVSAAGAIDSITGPAWGGLFVWEEAGGQATGIGGTIVTVPAAPNSSAGIQHCYGEPNSTGDRGFIQAFGDGMTGQPHLLRVQALPPNVFGYFLASLSTGNVMNAGGSQGTLCLGGSIGRFGIYQADSTGLAIGPLDTLSIAQPQGPVAGMFGERWNFQSWHRDAIGGTSTSNFTNAVALPLR